MRETALGIAGIGILIFCLVFYQQITASILLIGTVVGVVVGIAGLIALSMGVWYVKERIGLLRAQRRLADRDSHSLVVTSEHGVFIRETDKKATWLQIHQMPQWRVNGTPQEPTPLEVSTYRDFLASRHARPALAAQSEVVMESRQVDLLAALDSVQRCLIVGASDSGKTTLLQHIVSRRLSASEVVVIDPHAYPGKWTGCRVIGTGRNYAEIEKVLNALVKVMTKRYDEIGKGLVVEGQHSRLTILIDEWRAIIYNVKGASDAIKTLLTESRKAAFSVFVGTHSERVKALGIEGEGDLKDGFAVVRLSIVAGQRQATLDMGNGEVQAILPGPYLASQPQIIELELEDEPTEQEQQILDLKAAGASFNEICRQVYGAAGGKQIQLIKEILAKYQVQD